jgi:hypothetical protein
MTEEGILSDSRGSCDEISHVQDNSHRGIIKDLTHAAARDALALAFKTVADVVGTNKLFTTNSQRASQEILTRLLDALRGAG